MFPEGWDLLHLTPWEMSAVESREKPRGWDR